MKRSVSLLASLGSVVGLSFLITASTPGSVCGQEPCPIHCNSSGNYPCDNWMCGYIWIADA